MNRGQLPKPLSPLRKRHVILSTLVKAQVNRLSVRLQRERPRLLFQRAHRKKEGFFLKNSVMKLPGPEIITNLPIPLNELTETILFSSARIFKFERLSSLDSLASWAFLALLSLEYRNANIATAPKSTPRLIKMSGTS